MEPKNERTPAQQPQPSEQPPAPRKRFRIEQLEQRIAPKKGKSQGCAICPPADSSSSVSY